MTTRKLPSHGTVIAYIALFVALGGVGAYAAGAIGPSDIQRDAVRSKHIKDGQVKRRDLAARALDGGGVLSSRFTAPATNVVATAFGPVSGFTSATATADPEDFDMLTPNQDLVARDMTVRFEMVSSVSARRLVLYVNDAPTALSCVAQELRKQGVFFTLQCATADDVEVSVPAGARLAWMTDRGPAVNDTPPTAVSASVVLEAP
jgi:hypothetical protein